MNRHHLHAVTEGWLRPVADGLVAVLLAPVCAACREPLEHPTRGAVCDACWAAVVPTVALGCDAVPPSITLATAIGTYDGRLRDVIHALKYDPRPTIAKRLAARMREAGAARPACAGPPLPGPPHPSRGRGRRVHPE